MSIEASIEIPTIEELVARIQSDFKSQIPESNPFLANSFLLAFLTAYALRFNEVYTQMQTGFNSLFLQNSTDDFLESWGNLYGITRLAATGSEGDIVVTGTLGISIPINTEFQSSDNNVYTADSTQTIAGYAYTLSSLTRSGSIATAVTSTSHQFATGQTVTITGANETDYNGDFQIVVTSSTEFTYTLSTTPTSPATGTIAAIAEMAIVSISSVDTGSSTNQDGGSQLTLSSALSGINSTVFVGNEGLAGGEDEETDNNYRSRITFRVQNPVANFNASQIEAYCKEVNGVTRVWVQETTPALGSVTVYFVRDNDSNIIPTSTEIATVKEKLETIKPASMSDLTQLLVSAPDTQSIDFTFTTIVPSTQTLQDAIIANLEAYFKEYAGVGDDILELAYTSVIYNTIDPSTGEQVSDFTLSTPTGDISIGSSTIAILGNVTF